MEATALLVCCCKTAGSEAKKKRELQKAAIRGSCTHSQNHSGGRRESKFEVGEWDGKKCDRDRRECPTPVNGRKEGIGWMGGVG